MNTPRLCALVRLFPWLSGTTLLLTILASSAAAAVKIERAPESGLQPQAAVDERGVVHLIYFKGDPKAGDIFYTRRTGEPKTEWKPPIRVNSQAGSAIAVGTIRGAQLAIGRNGRVHVAWNGSGQAVPKAPEGTPMLYARLTDAGDAFEPQRNLMTKTRHLDGGGSVAADAQGNVYVVFHASLYEPDVKADESMRAVYLARSKDDGQTFSIESRATSEPTGACGCCGLKAMAVTPGSLFINYRTAREKVNRDMTLLASKDSGATFTLVTLGKWKGTTCPMSSTTFAAGARRLTAAWEIGSQVFLGGIDPRSGQAIPAVSPPGNAKRKHPAVAVNAAGQTLLAWTEGTGWNKGGSLAWQEFDADLRPIGTAGRASDVPVWDLPTAFAEPGGDFVIVY
jgi:hypothetical protein